jgi:hypothetical protein
VISAVGAAEAVMVRRVRMIKEMVGKCMLTGGNDLEVFFEEDVTQAICY